MQKSNSLSSPHGTKFSRIAFLSYLIEIYGAQLTEGSIIFICHPLSNTYVSLNYDTSFNPLSDTLFEFFNGVCTELQPPDRACIFRKSSIEFLKRLASTLNTGTLQSRKESVDKMSRQEIEGFQSPHKNIQNSAKDEDLSEAEILNFLTLLFGKYTQILEQFSATHFFSYKTHCKILSTTDDETTRNTTAHL